MNRMQKQTLEKKRAYFRKYRVMVAMHPWIFTDRFPRKPGRDSILELLMNKIENKELGHLFVVHVEE